MAQVRDLLARAEQLPGDSPRLDLELLLCHSLGKNRTWLYTWPEAEIEGDQLARFEDLYAGRVRGEPVAYLIGHREFWSLDLKVTPATLIPRPETETLVQWVLDLDLPEAARVADLGTGSGAIALALASEQARWSVTALDASAEALAIAQENASALGLERVRMLQSDWYAALSGERFDVLAANPPYVVADDPHLFQGDLRFEPHTALVAQEEGLADIQLLVSGAPEHLQPGGWLLLEHGFEQGAAVRALLQGAGFDRVETRVDIAGMDRITGGQLC